MWLIFVAVLVSVANAVMRKLFNHSSNAWLELQRYIFGAAFMLAAAQTLRQNAYLRVDILDAIIGGLVIYVYTLADKVFGMNNMSRLAQPVIMVLPPPAGADFPRPGHDLHRSCHANRGGAIGAARANAMATSSAACR